MNDTTRAVQMGGNLRRAVQALWLAIDAGPGHAVTIQRIDDGSMLVTAMPKNRPDTSKSQQLKPRTGTGTTLTNALLDLAGKMGLQLPPTEG